eukprot:g11761.t1
MDTHLATVIMSDGIRSFTRFAPAITGDCSRQTLNLTTLDNHQTTTDYKNNVTKQSKETTIVCSITWITTKVASLVDLHHDRCKYSDFNNGRHIIEGLDFGSAAIVWSDFLLNPFDLDDNASRITVDLRGCS